MSVRKSQSIAVILPAYNEEQTIRESIRQFHEALPEAAIVVVNNNSSDRTASHAEAVLRELGSTGQVIHEPRQGKGNALRRAFMHVDADIYVIADADLTYPPACVRDLIVPVIEGRADMVVGDRHSGGHYARENKRPLHDVGNRVVRWLVNRLFRAQLNDIMSGYRVFSRKFVKTYPILVEGFQLETDMTLHALDKRFRIVEIPIAYQDRPAGSASKINTLTDGALILTTIFRILRYYRPMAFFGAVAAFFFLAGLVAAIPVFEDWITTRYITHIPLAILAAALEVVAVTMFGIGLILDSLVHQQRMDYERHLLAEDRSGHLR